MHQRTYERLWSEVWQAEMQAEERLTIFMERLKRVEGRRRIRIGADRVRGSDHERCGKCRDATAAGRRQL
jgi:hypothetical protein